MLYIFSFIICEKTSKKERTIITYVVTSKNILPKLYQLYFVVITIFNLIHWMRNRSRDFCHVKFKIIVWNNSCALLYVYIGTIIFIQADRPSLPSSVNVLKFDWRSRRNDKIITPNDFSRVYLRLETKRKRRENNNIPKFYAAVPLRAPDAAAS